MSSTLTADVEINTNGYVDKDVQVLRDAAHIRQNPGMYIGNTLSTGLHHLVYELVYNSVDEALAGYCKHITMTIKVDGSLSVADDGRGIPVGFNEKEKKSTLELVMTTVGAGAKFDNKAYKVSAGLHGMGAKAVTALSEWTEAVVRRDGKTYHQKYECGKAVTSVKEIGAATTTGTTITFKPDPEIFNDVNFQYDVLLDRVRELAFLNRGLGITLKDERNGKSETFLFADGILEYVKYLNRDDDVEHTPPIYFNKMTDVGIRVEVSFQYHRGDEERVRCFANNAYNHVGGTHMSGFRTALTRTLGSYGEKEGYFKADNKPIGEDFREGLSAIVSVQLADPHFESQTKVKLNNPEVDGAVASVVSEHLAKFLQENPKDAAKIMAKVLLAAKAREAAKKARDAEKNRKNILNSGGLPGKLMDCTTRNREESELYLVEGDSAGGSAESGRDRMYQAILPLRGKPLNVEKAKGENLLKNEEIVSIISAVGVDIGNPDDISNVRYGKIVILTDADVDGQHIRTLLLTFFFRQMRKLVEMGHIYVSRPPLYKVVTKKTKRFIQTFEEMEHELLARGLDETRLTLLRPEGPVVIAGAQLARLVVADANRPATEKVALFNEVEKSLQILERRGVNLANFLVKAATPEGLPSFLVKLGRHEHWFHQSADVDAFRLAEEQRRGRPLVVADATASDVPAGDLFSVTELHEVRMLNRDLGKLKEFGIRAADLLPPVRIAGREPAPRFHLQSGENVKSLSSLRDLVSEVRHLGEKGQSITRFKGLGEMDPDELYDTTLDPKKRTMLQVTLDDAVKADEMFKILMGDKVEPRKKFIDDHALNVKDIDYHGA